jgi:hypothetical protein
MKIEGWARRCLVRVLEPDFIAPTRKRFGRAGELMGPCLYRINNTYFRTRRSENPSAEWVGFEKRV